MAHTFDVIERVGVSTESLSAAVTHVVKEATAEVPVSWFEVVEQRGRVNENGQVEFQVTVKLGRRKK